MTMTDRSMAFSWLHKNKVRSTSARTLSFNDLHTCPFPMTSWTEDVLEPRSLAFGSMSPTSSSKMSSLGFTVAHAAYNVSYNLKTSINIDIKQNNLIHYSANNFRRIGEFCLTSLKSFCIFVSNTRFHCFFNFEHNAVPRIDNS